VVQASLFPKSIAIYSVQSHPLIATHVYIQFHLREEQTKAKEAKDKARSCSKGLIIKVSLHWNSKPVAYQTLENFVTSHPICSFSEQCGIERKSWKICCSWFTNSCRPPHMLTETVLRCSSEDN